MSFNRVSSVTAYWWSNVSPALLELSQLQCVFTYCVRVTHDDRISSGHWNIQTKSPTLYMALLILTDGLGSGDISTRHSQSFSCSFSHGWSVLYLMSTLCCKIGRCCRAAVCSFFLWRFSSRTRVFSSWSWLLCSQRFSMLFCLQLTWRFSSLCIHMALVQAALT